MRLAAVLTLAALVGTAAADSKLGKEDVALQAKASMHGKNKLCCGYPLVDDLQWALRFYWMILEADYNEPASPNVPTKGRGKPLPDGSPGPSLACAVIVKTVDERTREKTGINDLLRD